MPEFAVFKADSVKQGGDAVFHGAHVAVQMLFALSRSPPSFPKLGAGAPEIGEDRTGRLLARHATRGSNMCSWLPR